MQTTVSPDVPFINNTGTGINGSDGSVGPHVDAVVVQPDGKIIIGGSFASLGQFSRDDIIRLNPDGTPDVDFDARLGTGPRVSLYDSLTFSANVQALALQPDGKILVGGWFRSWDDVVVKNLARLNPDGSLDTSFVANLGTSFYADRTGSNGQNEAYVESIALQSDGSILVGGEFEWLNGTPAHQIARLHPDGTPDTAFATADVGWFRGYAIQQIVVQPDDKILVRSNDWTSGGSTVNALRRLEPDGSTDAAFAAALGSGFAGDVSALALQPDGKIVVGGSFSTLRGVRVHHLVRLMPSGSPDTAFITRIDDGLSDTWSSVSSILVQPDGRLLVAGRFIKFNWEPADGMLRLQPDGTRDRSFPSEVVYVQTLNWIRAMALQADQSIVLVGEFNGLAGALGDATPNPPQSIARLVQTDELPTVGTNTTPLLWLACWLLGLGIVVTLADRRNYRLSTKRQANA